MITVKELTEWLNTQSDLNHVAVDYMGTALFMVEDPGIICEIGGDNEDWGSEDARFQTPKNS